MKGKYYDLVLVGSGFASLFFLHKYLANWSGAQKPRVLILERGTASGQGAPLQGNHSGSISAASHSKKWLFTLGIGGGSNCWWACTPRFLPNDFRMQSAYGVGVDWPLSYSDLERYYSEAEQLMQISGPDYGSFFDRSLPYPLPPHRFSDVDMAIKERFPNHFFQQPTARASRSTATRPSCCASGVCHKCPIQAKFMLVNDFASLLAQSTVELKAGCQVQEVAHSGQFASGVRYLDRDGQLKQVYGDVIALGANGIFNPNILQRSGLDHPMLGRGLNDQVGHYVQVDLAHMNGFNGSTSVTGHGYMFYDGDHRKERAACLMETSNVVENIRSARGKYTARLNLKFVFEDLPNANNRVMLDEQNPDKPVIEFSGHSHYTERGIDHIKRVIEPTLDFLPIEHVTHLGDKHQSEAHIQSTTVMGKDAANSVVDENLKHHRLKNVLVLGSSVFPTAPPANPTLTLSALSLRAADRL